ncbi:hypothetical protein HYC85_025656 [Camellia sinensis]|uniref:Uncharacterized protein n=1 Tax=Camellia sinensis TaxID=4442 RepID=A0A7J7GBP2_CAMSI|nr:hypothetical protein HYC85_025656 [Camellia sinensis]
MSSPQVLLKNPFLCICLFSAQITKPLFLNSLISMSPVVRPTHHSIICEAAPNNKADSAAKRARQAEKRRVYNKARKSEVKTRMKKIIPFENNCLTVLCRRRICRDLPWDSGATCQEMTGSGHGAQRVYKHVCAPHTRETNIL